MLYGRERMRLLVIQTAFEGLCRIHLSSFFNCIIKWSRVCLGFSFFSWHPVGSQLIMSLHSAHDGLICCFSRHLPGGAACEKATVTIILSLNHVVNVGSKSSKVKHMCSCTSPFCVFSSDVLLNVTLLLYDISSLQAAVCWLCPVWCKQGKPS